MNNPLFNFTNFLNKFTNALNWFLVIIFPLAVIWQAYTGAWDLTNPLKVCVGLVCSIGLEILLCGDLVRRKRQRRG